jgi:hypothetical protein
MDTLAKQAAPVMSCGGNRLPCSAISTVITTMAAFKPIIVKIVTGG